MAYVGIGTPVTVSGVGSPSPSKTGTANNLLVACCSWWSSSNQTVAAPAGWTLGYSTPSPGGGIASSRCGTAIFFRLATGGADSCLFSFANATFAEAAILEFSGYGLTPTVDLSTPNEVSGNNAAAATTTVTNSMTPTAAVTLGIHVITEADDGVANLAWSNVGTAGWTSVYTDAVTTTDVGAMFAYKEKASNAAEAPAWQFTASTNSVWDGALLFITGATVPSITSQPVSVAAAAGGTATFSVTAANATTYQWQSSTDGGSTFSNIGGATSTSYTTGTLANADNGKAYRVQVSDGTTTVNSATVFTFITGILTGKGSKDGFTGWHAKRKQFRSGHFDLLRKTLQFGDSDTTEAAVWGDWWWPIGTSNLSVSQTLPDAALSATVAVGLALSVSQSVPDATLSASVAALDSLSSSQAVPDATLVATAAARAGLSSSQAVPDATLSATATVRVALSSSQTLPDAALVATAAVRDSLSSTQTVPDAALVATASAPASLSSTQSVPDAALSAAMTARTGLSVAQAVPDAALSAGASVRVALAATQVLPDAALAASAAARVGLAVGQAVPDASLAAAAAVRASLAASQAVPDATLAATVTSGATLSSVQAVPDAVLVAAAAVRVSAGVTQLVPDAAIAAAAAAQVAVRATQAVPDAALSAHAGVVVAVSANQLVPDATLTATATAARAGQHVPDAVLVARISHVYPLLRPTPTERTLVIPARSRTLVVAAQRRVLDIPAQNRTLKCS